MLQPTRANACYATLATVPATAGEASPPYTETSPGAPARRLRALGLGDQVKFVGWVTEASDRALPACDIFVQSSLWDAMPPAAGPQALAEALYRLLSDAELRFRLGKAARTRHTQSFTVGHMVAAYENLYALLASGVAVKARRQ